MALTVEQIAEEALTLPSEARALLADRLVESLDPAEDGYIQRRFPRSETLQHCGIKFHNFCSENR